MCDSFEDILWNKMHVF